MRRYAAQLFFSAVFLLLAFAASARLTTPPLPDFRGAASVESATRAEPIDWAALEARHAVLAILLIPLDDPGNPALALIPCDPQNPYYRLLRDLQPPLGLSELDRYPLFRNELQTATHYAGWGRGSETPGRGTRATRLAITIVTGDRDALSPGHYEQLGQWLCYKTSGPNPRVRLNPNTTFMVREKGRADAKPIDLLFSNDTSSRGLARAFRRGPVFLVMHGGVYGPPRNNQGRLQRVGRPQESLQDDQVFKVERPIGVAFPLTGLLSQPVKGLPEIPGSDGVFDSFRLYGCYVGTVRGEGLTAQNMLIVAGSGMTNKSVGTGDIVRHYLPLDLLDLLNGELAGFRVGRWFLAGDQPESPRGRQP